MPEATVIRTFDLVRHDGTEQRFQPGVVDFTDADLEHWHVQGNIVGGKSLPPKPGSYEYHQLHPAVLHVNNVMQMQDAKEQLALAQEDAEITEQRSKARAERSKGYTDELNEAAATTAKELMARQQAFQADYANQTHRGYKMGSEPVPPVQPTEPSKQETVVAPANNSAADAALSLPPSQPVPADATGKPAVVSGK